jgi:hypothetical protein
MDGWREGGAGLIPEGGWRGGMNKKTIDIELSSGDNYDNC